MRLSAFFRNCGAWTVKATLDSNLTRKSYRREIPRFAAHNSLGGLHIPCSLVFSSVIHCVALSGSSDAVERAVALLNQMEAVDVRPSTITFSCVINAVAKSKRPGKALLALRILRRMQSVALRPETVTYNNVLNAW